MTLWLVSSWICNTR